MAKMSGRRAVKMALAISTEKRGFAAIDSHKHTDTHTAWHEGKWEMETGAGRVKKLKRGRVNVPRVTFHFAEFLIKL